MRRLLLLSCLTLPGLLRAQVASDPASPGQSPLSGALVGGWTGVLEYRDYSEPATSTKRVQLPTWLSITPDGARLVLHFVYDDGPAKTVEETETWAFDGTAGTFVEAGKTEQVYRMAGYPELKNGHGELVLTGRTKDNDKPAESRILLTVRRNLVAWTEEVRPVGSTEAFAFRHRYTFTRAVAPVAR